MKLEKIDLYNALKLLVEVGYYAHMNGMAINELTKLGSFDHVETLIWTAINDNDGK